MRKRSLWGRVLGKRMLCSISILVWAAPKTRLLLTEFGQGYTREMSLAAILRLERVTQVIKIVVVKIFDDVHVVGRGWRTRMIFKLTG